jgi:hypothetical protein
MSAQRPNLCDFRAPPHPIRTQQVQSSKTIGLIEPCSLAVKCTEVKLWIQSKPTSPFGALR